MSPAITSATRRVMAMSCCSEHKRGVGAATGSLGNGIGKQHFAGAGIYEDAEAAPQERSRNVGIPLDRPAFGAPSGARIDEYCLPAGRERHHLVGPGFGSSIHGEQGPNGSEHVAGNGRSQFHTLLNHVRAVGFDPLREEPARGAFAGVGFADDTPASRHAT